MAPLFALVRRVRLTTPTLTPTPPTTFHSESGNSLRGSWGKKRCCIWSYHRCTMSNAERESFMKPLTAVLSSLQQKSGRLEPLNKILCVSQLRKSQTWIACREWMAARAWVYLCARQRTNSKPRTSFFLFLQTTCLSVCYNNSTTKKVMSHSQSGVLHNAPWLHSAPNRNSSTLSARWALSSQLSALSRARCLLGSQTEHLEENGLGKCSDIFSCAANLMLRLITTTVYVKHLGLLKAYKRYRIWARVACEYQKKTFPLILPAV